MSGKTLLIAGRAYTVREVEGGWELSRGEGDGTVTYRVGAGGCNCPDTRYRGGPCKHLRALAEAGLVQTSLV